MSKELSPDELEEAQIKMQAIYARRLWRREREELNDAMTDFERQNEELETEVKKLKSCNVKLKSCNVELVSRNLELESRIHEL